MYLVELKPGKEELYRTSDELALAIRNGDVDARSRVYHRATAKWISITLHPQYRAIVSAAKAEAAERPTRRAWSLIGDSAEQVLETTQASLAQASQQLHRWRRPIALGMSGVLLLSGMQLAFSGPRPPWSESGRVPAAEQEAERADTASSAERTEVPAVISLAANREAQPVEPPPTDTTEKPAPRMASPVPLPRAPKIRSKSLRDALTPGPASSVAGNSLEAIFARYHAAHDANLTRLEDGMRVARLSRLFALPRLSPDGGTTNTRMSLAGAANFIRVYRQHQAAIEKAYQDTVIALARHEGWSPKKVRAWYSRSPRKEPATLEALSGSLLSSIDSLLGVLGAQAGAYKLRGTAIAFEDPTSGQAYGALRRRIKEQIDAAVAAGGATTPGPAGLLLQAIGTTSLPRET